MEQFYHSRLGNGIRLVHKKAKSPVCYIAITVNAGTRDEKKNQHGVAHLSEHMLFKGTDKHTPFQLNRLLENRGAEVNAYTTKEETVLHATCIRSDYTKMLRLLCEMFFSSRYLDKDIKSEKEIIYDEINSYKDSPSELIFDEFENELYHGSPLGRNILGDKRHLQSIDRSHVVSFTGERYNTDQIVVSSWGGISDREFQRISENIFSVIPENLRNYQRTKPDLAPLFNIEKHKNTFQTHYLFGGLAPGMEDDDRIAATVLSNILGGPFAISLLNQSLREKHSLTYNVESAYTAYSDSGLISVYFGCEEEKTTEAISECRKTIQTLKEKPLNQKILRIFKNQMTGSLMIANENPEALMLAVARTILIFGKTSDMEDIYRKIEAVSASDIQRIARKIFDDSNINSIMYR